MVEPLSLYMNLEIYRFANSLSSLIGLRPSQLPHAGLVSQKWFALRDGCLIKVTKNINKPIQITKQHQPQSVKHINKSTKNAKAEYPVCLKAAWRSYVLRTSPKRFCTPRTFRNLFAVRLAWLKHILSDILFGTGVQLLYGSVGGSEPTTTMELLPTHCLLLSFLNSTATCRGKH